MPPVNRAELAAILDAEGIPEDSYSLAGGLADDRLCIDEADGRWLVYYSERGKRWDEKWFSSEGEACRHLLELLRADPTIRGS